MSAQRRVLAGAALLVLAAGSAGCESTQDKSARLERQAAKVSKGARGLVVTRRSRVVKVEGTAMLADANGSAAVVELRNTSAQALAAVPVAITVRDRKQHVLYANDAAGLDDALVRAPLIAARGRLLWVHDQVTAGGSPVSVRARVGADARRGPASPPRIAIRGARLESDSSGVAAVGEVVNRSRIEQQRLVIFGVVRRHGRVVAAGRAIVPRLRAAKASRFSVFFIGNPRGGRLTLAAPPTTF